MTREEAISWLKELKWHEGEDVPIYDTDVEAINMAIEALKQEPCEDVVSRKTIDQNIYDYAESNGLSYANLKKAILDAPTVKHTQRWIPVNERLPEEHICEEGFHRPSESVLVQMKNGEMHTARYWSRYDERWLDLNYPTTDEVTAWMPLPEQYKEEGEE